MSRLAKPAEVAGSRVSERVRMTEDEAIAIHKPWMRELMRRCGIHVETFSDGTMGLVDVPAKYVAAIDALHRAVHHVMIGEDLPAFTPEEPKRKPSRRGGR